MTIRNTLVSLLLLGVTTAGQACVPPDLLLVGGASNGTALPTGTHAISAHAPSNAPPHSFVDIFNYVIRVHSDLTRAASPSLGHAVKAQGNERLPSTAPAVPLAFEDVIRQANQELHRSTQPVATSEPYSQMDLETALESAREGTGEGDVQAAGSSNSLLSSGLFLVDKVAGTVRFPAADIAKITEITKITEPTGWMLLIGGLATILVIARRRLSVV